MTTQTYKALLLEARNLRGQSGLNAHRRAILLTQVFSDHAFRAEVGAVDDYAVAAFLDAEVEDLCLSFLELAAILRHFPDSSQWADGKLRTLYEAACDKEKGEAKKIAADAPKRSRRTVTIKELETAESRVAEAEAALRHQERASAKVVSELDQIRAENQALRLENATLRGRIEELEKVLSRAGKTAKV